MGVLCLVLVLGEIVYYLDTNVEQYFEKEHLYLVLLIYITRQNVKHSQMPFENQQNKHTILICYLHTFSLRFVD